MVRLIGALMLVLVLVTPIFGQQSLVGTYKLISRVCELDGKQEQVMEHGYLVLTPTLAVFCFTTQNRKFGPSEADKAALFDTLVAWAGTYRIEENKLIIRVDTSWIEGWNGKDQIRSWELSGNRLMITAGPQPYGRDPSKTIIDRQIWEKIE
ncbi:MAG TPA: lipocalin-like domain-containing protein [Syntrophorhabdales bacterium]|nr:lipocalin-like domain-containing protein [Syntrophorhabdales bacterium]